MSAIIQTNHLGKTFGRKPALIDLSLEIPRGGVHAVVGSNGAGKTTLFRILLDFVQPTNGTSSVLGVDSRMLTPEIRGRVALVHEEHALPGWLTVRRLVSLHRAQYPRWEPATFSEVAGHFRIDADQRVSQLSRGERAGLNLALAFGQQPELLILDEPTLGLDVVAKQAFLESLLFTSSSTDCTIVYCSHQMDEIERVADQLILIDGGSLANCSSLPDFCSRISCWVAEFEDTPHGLDCIDGLLQHRVIEAHHRIVMLDADDDVATVLAGYGATSVHRASIGFDQAVNAFLSRTHRKPLEVA